MNTTTDKVRENAEKAFYATVGAPVVTTKKYIEFWKRTGEGLKAKAVEFKGIDHMAKATELRTKAIEDLRTAIDSWIAQGEELITGLKEQNVDLAEKVNLEQFQEQASKLRTQLEDLVANWRANFTPEEVVEKVEKVAKKAEAKVVETAKEVSEKLTKDEDLTVLNGVGPAFAARLKEANIDTFAKLAKADAAVVAEKAKVRVELAEKWIAQAKSL